MGWVLKAHEPPCYPLRYGFKNDSPVIIDRLSRFQYEVAEADLLRTKKIP